MMSTPVVQPQAYHSGRIKIRPKKPSEKTQAKRPPPGSEEDDMSCLFFTKALRRAQLKAATKSVGDLDNNPEASAKIEKKRGEIQEIKALIKASSSQGSPANKIECRDTSHLLGLFSREERETFSSRASQVSHVEHNPALWLDEEPRMVLENITALVKKNNKKLQTKDGSCFASWLSQPENSKKYPSAAICMDTFYSADLIEGWASDTSPYERKGARDFQFVDRAISGFIFQAAVNTPPSPSEHTDEVSSRSLCPIVHRHSAKKIIIPALASHIFGQFLWTGVGVQKNKEKASEFFKTAFRCGLNIIIPSLSYLGSSVESYVLSDAASRMNMLSAAERHCVLACRCKDAEGRITHLALALLHADPGFSSRIKTLFFSCYFKYLKETVMPKLEAAMIQIGELLSSGTFSSHHDKFSKSLSEICDEFANVENLAKDHTQATRNVMLKAFRKNLVDGRVASQCQDLLEKLHKEDEESLDDAYRRLSENRLLTETLLTEVKFGECTCCLTCQPLVDVGDKYQGGEHFEAHSCGHRFCQGCLSTYVSTSVVEGRTNVQCPHPGCKYNLLARDVFRLGGKDMYDKFIELKNHDHAGRLYEMAAQNEGVEENQHKVCPSCKVIIFRSEGCNDMLCVCGNRFNWNDAAASVTKNLTEIKKVVEVWGGINLE